MGEVARGSVVVDASSDGGTVSLGGGAGLESAVVAAPAPAEFFELHPVIKAAVMAAAATHPTNAGRVKRPDTLDPAFRTDPACCTNLFTSTCGPVIVIIRCERCFRMPTPR